MTALGRGEWSASRSGRFNTGERAPGTHWIGLVEPRADLDNLEDRKFLTLPGLELVIQPVAIIMVVGKYNVHLIYVVRYLSERL
jgi:hypothetical protein